MRSLSLLLAVALVTMSAASAHAQQGGAEAEVRELTAQVNRAYAANDLSKYWSYYASDLTQWWPEGRVDLASYQKTWTKFIADGGQVQAADVSDLRVQAGPGGDTAVATYDLHVVMKQADGKVVAEDNHETDVWFKRNGAWKIVHLHYSPKK